MIYFLWVLCAILSVVIFILIGKTVSLRRGADELRREFAARLKEDTNVGIDLSCNDRKMKLLAADIDRQLKLLRKEHIRYTRGDQELKDAVTNISHDLRTPLTAIWGYLDLIAGEELSNAAREYLSLIENRVKTLKELTEELFRYSVIVSVDTLDMEEISLNSAVEESIAGYYGAFKKAGIEPVIDMPDNAVKRRLNRQALSRILSNIITNAIRYSVGDFYVILTEDGTMYFKNKADKLDKVQVMHLFDRFYTVENGRNSTGLGLSIAKTLTEEMNGQMEAELADGMFTLKVWFPGTCAQNEISVALAEKLGYHYDYEYPAYEIRGYGKRDRN